MNNPLSHVGQTARPEGASPIASALTDVHLGVRFRAEAIARNELYEGRFTLLEEGMGGGSGRDDSYRPTTDNAWATPTEALTYATEAAHHAIEGIPPFTKGQPSGK